MSNPYSAPRPLTVIEKPPRRFRGHVTLYALIALTGLVGVLGPAFFKVLRAGQIEDFVGTILMLVTVTGAAYLAYAEWFGGSTALRFVTLVCVPLLCSSAFTLLRFTMMYLSVSFSWMLQHPVVFIAPFHSFVLLAYFIRVLLRNRSVNSMPEA